MDQHAGNNGFRPRVILFCSPAIAELYLRLDAASLVDLRHFFADMFRVGVYRRSGFALSNAFAFPSLALPLHVVPAGSRPMGGMAFRAEPRSNKPAKRVSTLCVPGSFRAAIRLAVSFAFLRFTCIGQSYQLMRSNRFVCFVILQPFWRD